MVVYFDWKTVKFIFTLAENVSHNLCNSNNTAPSIGIIWVTIYAPMKKSVTFTSTYANEIIPNV